MEEQLSQLILRVFLVCVAILTRRDSAKTENSILIVVVADRGEFRASTMV